MAYKNDIFISYRRNPETLEWINNHFVPLLSLRLGFELGRVRDQYHFMDLSDMTNASNMVMAVRMIAENILKMREQAPHINEHWPVVTPEKAETRIVPGDPPFIN